MRLGLDFGQRYRVSVRFDETGSLAVHVKQVFRRGIPGLEGKLADRDASASMNVGLVQVADIPPA